nr:hypothetical protein [Tanacetum cinerariifolium]
MDQQYPTVAKIPVLDTGKFKQWQFRIQQYLQHEHFALWEVIEFEDSYVVPASSSSTTTTDTTSGETGTKSGRTVTLTAEDMQKKKNDAAILKTFGGNEVTKKTKKNLLKQRYGNFKAEGSETLEQTFNRLQVIVDQLQFMDIKIKQNDLNQKFLTSLAPEWLMHTIVWRNRGDLDTMSLDDLYNHLRVYAENEDGNTACVSTASTNVPTASASVATISQDTACAYIASQSSGSQIKLEDINQIDEDEIEEMNIKWNMELISMGEDKAPRNQERGRRDNYRQGSKAKEQAPKALMAIDGVGWDWSYMANDEEDHALVADEVASIEFALMATTSAESKKLETFKEEKEGVDGKLAGLLKASKNLDNLIESQRSDKIKDGLGYNAVPPPPAQLYLSPKKDLSWIGLLECADDTVTDYSRPSPTVESTLGDDQNKNPSVFENVASPITPKSFIKFMRPKVSQSKSKTDKTESPKKPSVKVRKSFTPKLVAHRPYGPSQRLVKTNMNGARPNITSFNKQAHSYANRPSHRTSTVRSPYRAPWVPTVNRNFPPVNRKFSTGSRNFPAANRKFPTASRKFPTGSTKCSTANMGMKEKVVKPSACWFWKPSQNLSNKGPKNNSVSMISPNKIDDKGYWDSGCSRHMTGNISYLSDYEPFDGGYVSFGQGGCKIIGNRTIKTGKLEFENVYFMKDLKDFKLLDDANILLRTLRQHNMYSIDLNNIIPHRDLTCLVAKASADECMLWHRRLGHLNFKTMKKLVRHNLVKENQEKDKIRSKPDKNGKRGEAGKSLKQLQLKEEEKLKKTKKE